MVENGYDELDESERLTVVQRHESKEKIKKDAKALFMNQQALPYVIFPRVMGAVVSKEAWDLLQE